MATISVLDASGATQTIQAPNANGRAAAAASRPVALSTEDLAAIQAIATALGNLTFYPETQPVSGTVSVSGSVAVTGTFWQATQPVSVESLPLPSGAATSAKQDSIIAALGNPLTIGGTVAVSGTVPVSGPLTDAQLRAEAVPVSVTFPETQPVSVEALPLPAGAATGAKQDAMTAAVQALVGTEYETVAAEQTDQALGASGAVGDLLESLLIVPASTSPGAVQIKDGAGPAITVFAGGEDSVATLHPFSVAMGIRSSAGAWKVTTGANVSVVAAGSFA